MSFAHLVGKQVPVWIDGMDDGWQDVEIVGVEAGGIWIKNQKLTNRLLRAFNVPSAERTPTVFVPYHKIQLALWYADELALEEKAFGV